MERSSQDKETCSEVRVPHDWARLLRKLRWIGLEEEAKRLELAMSTLPAEERCIISFEPCSTDMLVA
jgi:hypothetical protein